MTKEVQAKSEEWTTQTAMYCDTFWLQSFGARKSFGKYKNLYVTVSFFVFEGNFYASTIPVGLYSGGLIKRRVFWRYEFEPKAYHGGGYIFAILRYVRLFVNQKHIYPSTYFSSNAESREIMSLTSNSWHYSCPRSVYCRSIVFLLVG